MVGDGFLRELPDQTESDLGRSFKQIAKRRLGRRWRQIVALCIAERAASRSPVFRPLLLAFNEATGDQSRKFNRGNLGKSLAERSNSLGLAVVLPSRVGEAIGFGLFGREIGDAS